LACVKAVRDRLDLDRLDPPQCAPPLGSP